ncbi:hypothetical protein C0J52_03054 [Blattella germanica]|nr:hypothetical protein C0J52_03054 [Blattella germanica]
MKGENMRNQILCLHIKRRICPLLNLPHVRTYCTEVKPDTKDNPTTWRKPWMKREGEWYSSFSLFASEKGNSVDLVRFLQKKIDLRPSVLRNWWAGIKREAAIMDMRYIPDRHEILGSDLAAAHFLVHRGAFVKFKGSPIWVKRVEDEYDLPTKYNPDYKLEAIDLSDMKLFYEGFRNMTNLKQLKWLSLKNSVEIDDWCLDRISGEYQNSLEYLDLSNCPQITYRGLGALYRMRRLRTLKLYDFVPNHEFHLTCLMLEVIIPELKIEGIEYLELKDSN